MTRRPDAHYLALAAVCIGAFMGQLDASIVTVAFPTFQRTFHASVGLVTWVGLSYLLVLVTLVTGAGRVSDISGRKLIYLFGVVVFVAGSALCGLAGGLDALIGFRVLQGVGAAMIQANSVAIIVLAVPRRALGRAIGIQGAAQGLGLAMGPTIGGLLVGLGGWRWIFLVNVPAGIVALAMGWFFLPRSRDLQPGAPFDWLGLGLFAPAVGALVCVVSLGDVLGWSSLSIATLAVIALVGGALFVRWERRTPSPMLDLSLFSQVSFSAGIASGLLSYIVLFGSLFAVPFFLERGLGMSVGRAGLVLAAMPISLGLTAPFAGRAAERLGARPLTVAGMLISAASLILLAAAHGSPGPVVVDLIVLGASLGLFTPANNAAIMGSAPSRHAGVASGVLNMTRGLGTAMGLALSSLVLGAFAPTEGASVADVTRGFEATVVVLAGIAVTAASVALLRTSAPLVLDPLGTAE